MAHKPPGPLEQDVQAARTLAEHLPQGYTADLMGDGGGGGGGGGGREDPAPPAAGSAAADEGDASGLSSSLLLQGGDVHRSLYRMAEAATGPAGHALLHHRAATFHGLPATGDDEAAGGPAQQQQRQRQQQQQQKKKNDAPAMPVRDLMAPQGFRRDFLLRQHQQQQQRRQQRRRQKEIRQRHAAMQRRQSALHLHRVHSFGAARLPITRNFVEFLELYGHFADEDLGDDEDDNEETEEGERADEAADETDANESDDDDDDEEEEDDYEDEQDTPTRRRDLEHGGSTGPGERRPLLGRRSTATSAAAVVAAADGPGPAKNKAGMAQAFFTLFKAFVGTGIMFLPKAYNNGGMAFSTATLLVVSLLSMAGFHLLLQCRQHCGGGAAVGYGDIGLAIAGPRMRRLVLGAIALSQLGFVCAGLVFCAENLASFAAAAAAVAGSGPDDGRPPPPVVSPNTLIALEVAVLVPLAFVRDIARLGPAALLGDVFIGLGLVYMYSYDVAAVAARGWRAHPSVAPWLNPAGAALTVGAAIFTFEGIGLILPIQSSMAQPARFGRLLAVVMVLITALYVSVGALGYAAFGTATRTEVIDNYPRASRLVQAVQCLYALAVLAGLPVQLFPAVRILEAASAPLGLGARRGKRSPRVKWAKNALRTALVVACGAVAATAGGAGRLDQFVALIGSLACVPLLFVFPPYLHYRAVAAGPWAKAADVALMAVGGVAMVFTTVVTVSGGGG